MDVKEALKARKSIRAFLDKDVPQSLVVEILEFAKLSPSSTNMQPWEVCVVSGNTKAKIEKEVLESFKNGLEPNRDYEYYPKNFIEPYLSRRREVGKKMYSILGIAKDDKIRAKEQWMANYISFNAPVALYFFIDKTLKFGSYLDYGMFLQSIMLLATNLGLSTCAQGSLSDYPDIVKSNLGIKKDKILLCGMALGYADENAKINKFQADRINLEEFAKFYG